MFFVNKDKIQFLNFVLYLRNPWKKNFFVLTYFHRYQSIEILQRQTLTDYSKIQEICGY